MRIAAKYILLTAVAVCAWVVADASVTTPVYDKFRTVEDSCRPFVRWWWNGNKLQKEEITRELEILKEAGIGGVEINPIEFPSRIDTSGIRSLVWLSDEWIDMLKYTFDEASRIGLTCDLIVGSGWPFGAEDLPLDERASVMLTYAVSVEGGSDVELSKFHIFKSVDPGVTVPNERRTFELVTALMTPDPINDLGEAVDIMDRFNGDLLTLKVPEGKHVLYFMVRVDSFASVINGAPGAAGSILNHMDAKAVRKYLDRMSDTIEGRIGPLSQYLRAFFVDGMELEGNNWTEGFAEEFERRRGYDVRPWLPFTMFKVGRLGNVEQYDYGASKGERFREEVNRVRFDFELTKAELLNERYMATLVGWCRDKKVKSRIEAYGRGFFPIESALDVDIPEGESWTMNWLRHRIGEEMGDADYRRGRSYTMINKYVTSAAHLTGKRLVSCEEMTNTYMVFITSLEFLRMGSDMNATTGITHSVWHGFNYSPPSAGFPGWVQYGSYYSDRNTWWPYFRLLNDYRARMSSVLQRADMVTDIALLPANMDLWTEMGVQTDPFPDSLNVPYTSLIWEAIHKNGGGADYVTEEIIRNSTVRRGRLCYGPKEYGTIFMIEVGGTTPEVLDKLEEFVAGGGRVFCIGKYPCKSLGLKNWEQRDAEIVSRVERLKSYSDRFILLDKPSDGKYLEWYTDVSNRYSIPHCITIESPDRFLLQSHFVMDDKSDVFLFVNASLSEDRCSEVIFPKSVYSGRTAWLYDASTGERYRLPITKDGRMKVAPGPAESWLVVFNRDKGGRPMESLPLCDPSDVNAIHPQGWKLSLTHKVLGWTRYDRMDVLTDLKDTGEWKNFAGDVTYTATVHLEKGRLPSYIDLGKVADICSLRVNGHDCGVKWYGRRIYDISGLLHEGDNTLEVTVTTLLGNYVQTLKDSPVAQRFMFRRNNPLVPAGLIGPVTLY